MVLLTMALDDDVQRLSLLKRHTYERTEGFDVLYRRSLGTPIVAPKLDPSLLLRHPTDADLDARVDVHRDSWSVWGPSAMSKTTVVCETRQFTEGSFLAYCIGWLDVARPLRTGRQPSQFHGTWICTRRDDRGHAQDASARDAYGAGRHRER